MSSRSSLVLVLLLAGCGPCPTPAHPEEPAAEPAVEPDHAAPANGPGQLDAETAALAASLNGVEKIELEVGASGAVEAISIYHHDADSVPAAIRQLAEQRFPGATVRSYETELYREGGRTYEVEVTTADGKVCELSATADATLRYVECELPAAELPAAVTATIASTVSGGEVREAEKKTDAAGADTFSVEVVASGVEHYLRIAPDGALRGHGLRRPAMIEVPAP